MERLVLCPWPVVGFPLFVECHLEPLGKDRDGLFMCENGQSSAWRLDGGTRSVSPGVEPRRRVPVGYGSRSATQKIHPPHAQTQSTNPNFRLATAPHDTLVHASTVRIAARVEATVVPLHSCASRLVESQSSPTGTSFSLAIFINTASERGSGYVNGSAHARVRDRPALSTSAPDLPYRLYRGQDHLFM